MNNVAFSEDLQPPNTRLLKLLHLKTRSVCTSRQAEWRAGQRWTLREEADGTGALNGVEFMAAPQRFQYVERVTITDVLPRVLSETALNCCLLPLTAFWGRRHSPGGAIASTTRK